MHLNLPLFQATNSNYIFTMFNALAWPDTVSVNKIARVIPHIVKFVSSLAASSFANLQAMPLSEIG